MTSWIFNGYFCCTASLATLPNDVVGCCGTNRSPCAQFCWCIWWPVRCVGCLALGSSGLLMDLARSPFHCFGQRHCVAMSKSCCDWNCGPDYKEESKHSIVRIASFCMIKRDERHTISSMRDCIHSCCCVHSKRSILSHDVFVDRCPYCAPQIPTTDARTAAVTPHPRPSLSPNPPTAVR